MFYINTNTCQPFKTEMRDNSNAELHIKAGDRGPPKAPGWVYGAETPEAPGFWYFQACRKGYPEA